LLVGNGKQTGGKDTTLLYKQIFVISRGGTIHLCFLSSCGFNQTIQSQLAQMNTGALSPTLNH